MRKHEYVAKEITDEQVVSLLKKAVDNVTNWNSTSKSFKDKTRKEVFYEYGKEPFTYESKCILVKEFMEYMKFKKRGEEIEI